MSVTPAESIVKQKNEKKWRPSGRGGVGNIQRNQPEVAPHYLENAPHGREVMLPTVPVAYSGRGGIGNVHTHWIEPEVFERVLTFESGIIEGAKFDVKGSSSGRGGSGNISTKDTKEKERKRAERASMDVSTIAGMHRGLSSRLSLMTSHSSSRTLKSLLRLSDSTLISASHDADQPPPLDHHSSEESKSSSDSDSHSSDDANSVRTLRRTKYAPSMITINDDDSDMASLFYCPPRSESDNVLLESMLRMAPAVPPPTMPLPAPPQRR